MISALLEWLAQAIITVIDAVGYAGIFFLMALDSFNIPIPSEVTMPFSGFLASQGRFSFWLVVLAGTAGSYAGSVLSYYLAEWLVTNRHKAFLHILISDSFLERSRIWFLKYGALSVFIGRMLPVIRTFISLPAGIGNMRFSTFTWLTILGSFIWSVGLTYVGWVLGEHWETLGGYFHSFDIVILAAIIILAGWWIYRHLAAGRGTK